MEDRFIVLDNHESRSDTCFLEFLMAVAVWQLQKQLQQSFHFYFLTSFLKQIPPTKTMTKSKFEIFFAMVIKADYREKEEPGNEETNKTSPYESVCQVLLENADFSYQTILFSLLDK